jgi:uncharacterized membrane protein
VTEKSEIPRAPSRLNGLIRSRRSLKTAFLVVGIVLCLLGGAVVFFQLSESCEDSPLAGAYRSFPWCSDALDHINFTFLGLLALFAGIIVLALGSRLHWLLEPGDDQPPDSAAVQSSYTGESISRLNPGVGRI